VFGRSGHEEVNPLQGRTLNAVLIRGTISQSAVQKSTACAGNSCFQLST
jgi:hypothetical protein